MTKTDQRKRLVAVPIAFAEASEFVKRFHRHHKPPTGHKFSVACAVEGSDDVCGVAMVGRPVSRHLDNGWTLEVNRVATDGTANACSFLYSRAWKAARALGYRRLITYTLPEEGGASLRGGGWRLIGEAGGGSWSCKSRPRIDMAPTQVKLRWEKP